MEQEQIKEILDKTAQAANALADTMDADIVFFSGDISWNSANEFLKACKARKKPRKEVLLVLVTSGGRPHSGYRIARCLQQKYKKFSVFVPGWCKSAGTLIVSGAHHIYMSEPAELGPLDIQLSRKDEIWTGKSGLVVDASVKALETTAERMFFQYINTIKERHGSVTYKTAASIAVDLVGKLLAPIYSQIDPSEIGENSRTMNITKNYATRLDREAKNFKSQEWLSYLVEAYPDHSFVIDRKEAGEIFTNVSDPTEQMETLETALDELSVEPVDTTDGESFAIRILSDEPASHLTVVDSGPPGVAS